MALTVVFLVTAWAVIEAVAAIANAAHATGRRARRNMFTGRIDWSTWAVEDVLRLTAGLAVAGSNQTKNIGASRTVEYFSGYSLYGCNSTLVDQPEIT
jgi:hypothetical protein